MLWESEMKILWNLDKAAFLWYSREQWHNRQGAECSPRDFWLGNFCWPTGKKEAKKKGKGWKIEKKKENCKRERGKLKMEGGKVRKWFFFFFFFFCFSLFKTTKICFGSTKMEIFYQEKAFHAGKKIGKNDFAPSEKFSCYTPSLEPCCGPVLCSLWLVTSIMLRAGWNTS